METSLSDKSFRVAKSAIEQQGLFKFKPVCELTKSGRSTIVGWEVENLHGFYIKSYWEKPLVNQENLPAGEEDLPPQSENLSPPRENFSSQPENLPDVEAENQAAQEVKNSQLGLNKVSTPSQPITKVMVEKEEYIDSVAITSPPLRVATMATSNKDKEKEKAVQEVCEISALCGYEPNLIHRQELSLLTLALLTLVKNGLRRPISPNDLTAQQIFERLLATALHNSKLPVPE